MNEQNVSKITKGIIAILFRDYWATPIQKEKIIKKQKIERQKIELQKQEKYNIDVFKKKKQKTDTENMQLVKIEKEKWNIRLIKFIKNLLNK